MDGSSLGNYYANRFLGIIAAGVVLAGATFGAGYFVGKSSKDNKISKEEEQTRIVNIIREDLEHKANHQISLAARELDLPFGSINDMLHLSEANNTYAFTAQTILKSTNNYAKYNLVQGQALASYAFHLDSIIEQGGFVNQKNILEKRK